MPPSATPRRSSHGTQLRGRRRSPSRPTDGKAKAIFFVAHWCPHCQAEIPRLSEWLKTHGLPGRRRHRDRVDARQRVTGQLPAVRVARARGRRQPSRHRRRQQQHRVLRVRRGRTARTSCTSTRTTRSCCAPKANTATIPRSTRDVFAKLAAGEPVDQPARTRADRSALGAGGLRDLARDVGREEARRSAPAAREASSRRR